VTDIGPVLAEVVRSGFVEGRHHGVVVGLDASGQAQVAVGSVREPMFPRSSNKPLQATAMLRCGLDVDGALLAVACASHSGEDAHVRVVRELLARYDVPESALDNTPGLPLDPDAARELVRGAGPDRVHQNCSGKHAAMLATCRVNGWPLAGYREPAHPLQAAIRRTMGELAGEPVAAVGVDGCGAALFALSPVGLATAFRALVLAEPGSAERRVADAMRAHPFLVAGTGRDDTALMQAVPGLIAKAGAEGVGAAATADGRAVAVKVSDGAERARLPVLLSALGLLGVDVADRPELRNPVVLGHGEPVGEVRSLLSQALAAQAPGRTG
jgi:L-asparaginase II